MEEKALFTIPEEAQGFTESELYKIVQALRSEFGLTNWEWLAQQLEVLCFSAYGAEVSAKMEEENSWHKVSKILCVGDRYWNDNNTASIDWWRGELFIKWETCSGHTVSFSFELVCTGDGAVDKMNWTLKKCAFGSDESTYFYQRVEEIVKEIVEGELTLTS